MDPAEAANPRDHELLGLDAGVEEIFSAASVASAISSRNAFAVSSRRTSLIGFSPLMNRRIARSSILSRRENAVVPPNSWTQ
jgi:hypothetical protein